MPIHVCNGFDQFHDGLFLKRIVAKLGQLLGHCDALKQRIQESRRLAGQLPQTALCEALAGLGGATVAPVLRAGRKAAKQVVGVGNLFA